MENKETKIMETIGKALDLMSEQEKERVLAFSEGIAFMADKTQSAAPDARGA